MKREPKKKLTELACTTCGTPHDGGFGSGTFCSSSCSRVVGAKARWNRHRTAASSGEAEEVSEADSAGWLGLVGEKVVVRDGKTVLRGCVVAYDAATDRHQCVLYLQRERQR